MITLDDVVVTCSDCKQQFRGGSLWLEVWDFGFLTNIGVVRGSLIPRLAQHHDDKRSRVHRPSPQHAEFTVSRDGRYLGELGPVSSMGAEIKFVIRDRAILTQFYEEIRGYQRSSGYW